MWRALIVLALIAGAARADGPRTIAIGFDHTVHERDLEVSGASPIACAHCHDEKAGRLVGRPGHAACFGTCHGSAPSAPKRGAKLALDDAHLRLCTNCHAEAALIAPYAGTLTVGYPPYRIDRDFSLVIGHKQHRDVACMQCHDPITKKPAAPHARCVGCHDGSATKGHTFAMATCTTCHPAAVGKPQPPELKTVQDTVTSIFSHATHAARGGAGKDCTTCHAKVRDATETDIELPRPTAGDCEHCHDGKQAFAVTAACTRCHDEPKQRFTVYRPTARFRHDGHHEQLVADQACTTCHLLDAKSGEIAIVGHAACASTSCHHNDFGERKPEKCGACHNSTEPWRHLRADRGLPDTTEFGASLDHAKHPAACATCHSLQTATTQLRTPHGHVSCVGGACHAATGGASPHLTECAACHTLGLAAARLGKTTGAAWSVRLAFDHAPHAKDATGAAVACRACHTSLEGQLVALPTPAKATCAPCHDGARAFKLTGTTCRRCHTGTK